jgi:solute carrier family 25 iron transporter 28/37
VNDALGGNQPGHQQLAHAGAGAVATMAHDAVITPLDVVKQVCATPACVVWLICCAFVYTQRLQLMHSPYKGIVDCFRGTLKAEGLSAFFASYPTTVLMNIPMQAGVFRGLPVLVPTHWSSLF